jgi:hypothetical protein
MEGYHIHFTYNGQLPQHLPKMNGYHSIYLQLVVTTKSTYNGRLPYKFYLQWKVIITSTYNEWLSYHLLTMNGYLGIYLQWTVTIAETYNERLPQHLLIMNGYYNIYLQ